MSSNENNKDLIKKCFETREGVYRISEYIEGQPRQAFGRASFPQGADSNNPSAPVRISCSRPESGSDETVDVLEHICFNHGRELHFMPFSLFKSHSADSETTKMYKGTIPTCHDVLVPNSQNAVVLAASIRNKTEQQQQQQLQNGVGAPIGSSNGTSQNGGQALPPSNESSQPRFFVLVGFGAGQIQLFEASKPQQYVFFNESRGTDSTRVSSIKWVPNSATKFLAAHASGHIYLYDTALPCDHQKPVFVQIKTPMTGLPNSGGSVVVLSANKNKGENPTHRLSLRTGCVNHIAFSQCGYYLALACQDGFLRVFRWVTAPDSPLNLELCVAVRSFFGGMLCVAWSPDGRYLATGGEDDLVTLVSFNENRVVCRGRGHKSWITSIAFDPYACVCGQLPASAFAANSSLTTPQSSKVPAGSQPGSSPGFSKNGSFSAQSAVGKSPPILYRLASVGQDTLLCLWELTEDVLVTSQQQLIQRQRLRSRSSLLVSGPLPTVSIFSPSGTSRQNSSLSGSYPNPVKNLSTDTSNILSVTSPSLSNANGTLLPLDVDVHGGVNVNSNNYNSQQQPHLTAQRSPSTSGRCTPSPSSTVGSASGSSIAGALASKFAFWHRDKYKMGSKQKSHKRSKEKRGSLSSTVSAITHLDQGSVDHFPAVNSSNSSHQVRSSVSDIANGISNGAIASSATLPSSPSGSSSSLLGTAACPRLGDVPVIEPLVVKKIAADPLSGVAFLKECLLTACQAGYLAVWSRPNVAKENAPVNGTSVSKIAFEKQASVSSSNAGGSGGQEVSSSFL